MIENGRFVVQLENNHHYILIDTVTGYQYYTPAQDDALAICGMLNSKDNLLVNQRNHIQHLKGLLKKMGVEDTSQPKYCKNCKYGASVSVMGDDKDCWCEVFDRSVGIHDCCSKWVAEE